MEAAVGVTASVVATSHEYRITILEAGGSQYAVLTTGSYSNPSWIVSLAGSKITGNISGNAASITGTITESQVVNLVADLAAKQPLITFVDKEVPSGAIDGSNAVFTLAHAPSAGAEHVFLNGILQQSGGGDYAISGATATFNTPPDPGSVLLASYRY